MLVENWVHGQLGVDIWFKKYRYENETFDDFLDRISNGDKELRNLIEQKKFLFGGRILASRGLQNHGKKITYSNCFVVAPPEDNLESIYDCAKKMARTYSYGGGVGVDLSKLRPRQAKTNNASNTSTGAVSFMELYDMTTGLISQNGRRGALMLSLSCEHPDLEEFIGIKSQQDKITKANISIRITDAFMNAVKNNLQWEMKFTVESSGEVITRTANAKDIMYTIAKNNWAMAEPGFLFWDKIEKWNLLSEDKDFKFAGVNPCAEETLPAGGSCLLGSLNLAEFVSNNEFNFESFQDSVRIAVVALNDVLDEGLELLPLDEQKQSVSDYRQIGLGVFGLADMFIKLGIRYGSKESVDMSNAIGSLLLNTSIGQSALIAKDKGTFPKYSKDVIFASKFFQLNISPSTKSIVERYGLRNSQLLTCAPTGTLSTMLGVSGGIEPIFSYSYDRRTQSLHGEDVIYKVYTPIVEEYMKLNGLTDESHLPDFFNNAMMLNYEERIEMQSTWQKWIDASISSTVNLPEETTIEEVIKIYTLAWEKGLKGITIYRNNCSRQGILTTEKPKEVEEPQTHVAKWEKLPKDILYHKRKLRTGCGKLNLFIGYSDSTKKVHDLYAIRSGTGGCEKSVQTTIIAMAGMLRLGGNIFNIEKAFNGTGGCNSFVVKRAKGENLSKGSSCGTAVLFEIKEFLREKGADNITMSATPTEDKKKKDTFSKEEKSFIAKNGELDYIKKFNKCPLCNEHLNHTDGCISCPSCSYSKCD